MVGSSDPRGIGTLRHMDPAGVVPSVTSHPRSDVLKNSCSPPTPPHLHTSPYVTIRHHTSHYTTMGVLQVTSLCWIRHVFWPQHPRIQPFAILMLYNLACQHILYDLACQHFLYNSTCQLCLYALLYNSACQHLSDDSPVKSSGIFWKFCSVSGSSARAKRYE